MSAKTRAKGELIMIRAYAAVEENATLMQSVMMTIRAQMTTAIILERLVLFVFMNLSPIMQNLHAVEEHQIRAQMIIAKREFARILFWMDLRLDAAGMLPEMFAQRKLAKEELASMYQNQMEPYLGAKEHYLEIRARQRLALVEYAKIWIWVMDLRLDAAGMLIGFVNRKSVWAVYAETTSWKHLDLTLIKRAE
jgi:hypothetical protein